jgi:hypothetical protein
MEPGIESKVTFWYSAVIEVPTKKSTTSTKKFVPATPFFKKLHGFEKANRKPLQTATSK